jgi:hypothetical protein
MSTWKILGNPNRSFLMLDVKGESRFDMAVVPRGESPEGYWLDGVGGDAVLNMPHVGDVYFRDTDNVGDETVRSISNVKCVFVEVL